MNKTMLAYLSQYKIHLFVFFIGVITGAIAYKLLESRIEGFTLSMGNGDGKIVMSDDDILLLINNVFTLEEEFTKADIKHVVNGLKKAYMNIILDGTSPNDLLSDATFKKQLIERMLASEVDGEFKFKVVVVKEKAYLKRLLNTQFTKDELEKEIEFMAKYYVVRKNEMGKDRPVIIEESKKESKKEESKKLEGRRELVYI